MENTSSFETASFRRLAGSQVRWIVYLVVFLSSSGGIGCFVNPEPEIEVSKPNSYLKDAQAFEKKGDFDNAIQYYRLAAEISKNPKWFFKAYDLSQNDQDLEKGDVLLMESMIQDQAPELLKKMSKYYESRGDVGRANRYKQAVARLTNKPLQKNISNFDTSPESTPARASEVATPEANLEKQVTSLTNANEVQKTQRIPSTPVERSNQPGMVTKTKNQQQEIENNQVNASFKAETPSFQIRLKRLENLATNGQDLWRQKSSHQIPLKFEASIISNGIEETFEVHFEVMAHVFFVWEVRGRNNNLEGSKIETYHEKYKILIDPNKSISQLIDLGEFYSNQETSYEGKKHIFSKQLQSFEARIIDFQPKPPT